MMYPEVCVVVWFTLCCVGIWCVAMQRTCAPRLSGRAKAQTPAADYWTSYRVRTLTTHVLNTLFESTKSQFKSHKHENTDRETHYTGPQTSSLKPTAWSQPHTHRRTHKHTRNLNYRQFPLRKHTHTHTHRLGPGRAKHTDREWRKDPLLRTSHAYRSHWILYCRHVHSDIRT